MKKKMSVSLVFAIVLMLMATVALAAASRAGLLDFISRYSHAYIPQDAQSYIVTDLAAFDSDNLTVSVRESYFDGRTIRMTVDVAPKAEGTLLISSDFLPEDSWQNLIHLHKDQIDASDARTIQEVGAAYDQVYRVDVTIAEGETPSDSIGGSYDYVLNPETGVLTFFLEESHVRDREQRSILLNVYCRTMEDQSERETLSFPLTLDAVEAEQLVCQCSDPAVYETAGVRVNSLLIEVRPQDIYATIDFTMLDTGYIGIEDSLWFEFVDPDSTETEPYKQRLADGMSGHGTIESVGGGRFVQRMTLGRNELHESYILRAYDAFEKTRFESHIFEVKPVE